MAFGFFKDKSKEPLTVTCPLCSHSQQESPLAVSSYCKGCKAYLSFSKTGEIEARPQSTPDPFAHRPAQPKVEIEYKAREEKPPNSVAAIKEEEKKKLNSETKAEIKPELATQPAPEPTADLTKTVTPSPPAGDKPPEIKTPAQDHPAIPTLPKTDEATAKENEEPEELTPRYYRQNTDEDQKNHKKDLNQRLAICFECGDSHLANANANSTQCRKCGRLISLEDKHIKEGWSSPIKTRGDVYIHKKGTVLGATIQCHHLIVEGNFTGSAECSGDLTLRRHGKIFGKVVCDRLLVEKRAKIEFLNTVEMNECKIDGLVTGNLSCSGRLALEKRATLTGNIKVGALTIADGAKHTGQIQMAAF